MTMTPRARGLAQAGVIIGIVVGCVTVAVHLGVLPWVTAKEMESHEDNHSYSIRIIRQELRQLRQDTERNHQLLILHHNETVRLGIGRHNP